MAYSGFNRNEYFVTSKIPGAVVEDNYAQTTAHLGQCLDDLGLEYVDLMLVHWPSRNISNAARQMQWKALEDWAKQGKARAIGISHYCKTDIEEVLAISTLPIALAQNQYHVGMAGDSQPVLHDKAYTESKGILYMGYSSLCGPCPPPHNRELINGPLVTSIGKAYNKTGAQVSLRYLVQNGIPVIPKSSNPVHIAQNFDLFDFILSDIDMKKLNDATSPPETGTAQKPDDAQDCAFESNVESLPAFSIPVLSRVGTIASLHGYHLRDPTSPVFSSGLWHFFCTAVPVENGTAGYAGRVFHFYSRTLDGPFASSGIAVDVTHGEWDSWGTFTPSIFKENDDSWIMFYGGVGNGSSAHIESVGMATASSPFGKWTKSPANPIIESNGFAWCGESGPARVDEAEPYIIGGKRLLLVKTVCNNFTALPMLYSPASNEGWSPPFKAETQQPIIAANVTAGSKGFEQARIFPDPNYHRILHLTGNDHGDGRQPHFIRSMDASPSAPWTFVGYLDRFGEQPVMEPTPVTPAGATPGDDINGAPDYFITFTGNPFHIDLLRCAWVAPS